MSIQYKHSETRERFEDRVYTAYFISQVTKALGVNPKCLGKSELCKRNADGTDYERTEISAAWFGWCLALDNMHYILAERQEAASG